MEGGKLMEMRLCHLKAISISMLVAETVYLWPTLGPVMLAVCATLCDILYSYMLHTSKVIITVITISITVITISITVITISITVITVLQ